MTCDQARALYSELADAALTAEVQAALTAHLAGCPDCRGEWEGFQRMLTLLREMPRARAPQGFVDRVLSATQPAPWSRRLVRSLFVPLRVKVPLEVAALLIVAGAAVYLMPRPPELRQAVQPQEPESRPVPSPAPAPAVEALADAPRAVQVEVAPSREEVPERLTAKQEGVESDRQRSAAAMPPPESAPIRGDQGGRGSAVGVAPARRPVPETPAPSHPAGQQLVAERLPTLARPQAVPWPGARTSSEPTISGHLAVRDPQAAEQALADLLRRVGAVEVRRNVSGNLTAIELEVTQGAWSEFVHGLGDIGAWAPDSEPADWPPRVVVIVRMGR